MKALVLGGTRFIGLRLVRKLVAQGHEVTLLNRGQTQPLDTPLPEGIYRLYADRRQPEAVRQVLAGHHFDVIYDMTGYQIKNLEPLIEMYNGQIQRFVFCSTCAVFAETEQFPITEDFPYRSPEIGTPGLRSYPNEKVQCETYLFKAYKEKGFPIAIVRPTAVYGPENWMDDREGSYFVRLLLGRKILIPGTGNTIQHRSHVDDVVDLFITCATHPNAAGQAFVAADPKATTINGWIDILGKVVGVVPQKVYLLDFALLRRLKPGLDHPLIFPFRFERNTIYSIQKAKNLLGWQPKYDIESGLKHTYKWWRQHRGIEKTELIPGKLGHDVDFAYEDELLRQYGS